MAIRFHQSVAFLETDQLLDLCRACDGMGYAGIYVSDHLFYPKELKSPYPYSPHPDGRPIWQPEADWPDSWCLISAMAAVTRNLEFTTGVYIAPARDLITVAKLVGTAAVISNNRVNLGLGAGWCEEEFDQTGQSFKGRGARLDDMMQALRALWRGGWVEYHGTHYDVPAMQMNPAPTAPVPIHVGGHSAPAIRRAARLGDGWIGSGPYDVQGAWDYVGRVRNELEAAGRKDDPFRIFLAINAMPEPDLYKPFAEAGIEDFVCAPWMMAGKPQDQDYRSSLEAKVRACEQFAETVIAKVG